MAERKIVNDETTHSFMHIKKQDDKCKHWKKIPSFCGSNPICAFPGNGCFEKENWNCRIMNEVRDIAEKRKTWHGDHNCAIIPIYEYKFAIICWYKHRGQTEGFWIIDGENVSVGCEQDAFEIIEKKKVD